MKLLIQSWQEAEALAAPIRREVFVEEQHVPIELELDSIDSHAWHALAFLNGACIGTGRLYTIDGIGQIGRMAVLAACRRQGVGSALLSTLVQYAQSLNIHSIYLNAQIAAIPFYAKFNFIPEGAIFNEAGIPHRTMRLD
ncbi:GNAT family N-acetyltransferase [Polynucleobacter sp. IMCC30063]|uniref:GNAT family N-acetyltransferase n=1 Tax=unclassified Polynucleobacter TaxID=2640945 RepID=UPI001F2545A6|nr:MULTISPECIES: GNAT family N-acetyltransferase [unclassified Polynucleobacter]MCE7506474.1 GNAT family N-acetyltransferase [Polynucleobacter sp. IMCC30063]MCE7527746.1 GNAT family N-acetyltransferase [Polynucleobacter sp. IMCC 30228]